MFIQYIVPASGGLLQAINRLLFSLQTKCSFSFNWFNLRLSRVNLFFWFSMEKNCIYIHLGQFQSLLNRQYNNSSYRFKSHYRSQSFIVLCASGTLGNKSSLVPFNWAISIMLYLLPLAFRPSGNSMSFQTRAMLILCEEVWCASKFLLLSALTKIWDFSFLDVQTIDTLS